MRFTRVPVALFAVLVAPLVATPALAQDDVREVWDPAGHLVRRLTLTAGALTSEETWAYDAAGRATTHTTVAGGATTVEAFTYDADGHVTVREVRVGDVVTRREESTWAKGRLATQVVTEGGASRTTAWTYDAAGNPVLVETRDASGAVIARTVSDRAAPPVHVPFTVGVTGGFGTNTDVRATSLTGGFSFSRVPTPAQFDAEPLEVRASGSYTRTTSAGEVTNDDLKAGFGLDYNELVGPLTVFLFTNVERNPVANLDVDLVVAPVGAKVDIVQGTPFAFDVSFAPVWNYRSIATPAGGTCDGVTLGEDGHCTFSKIRGSLRVRAVVEAGGVKLKDVVEFLPTLNPDGGDVIAAIPTESIFRNTASLDVKIAGHLSLGESVVFTRDMLLAEQADCVADPESRLCAGQSIQTGTTLTLSWSL